MKVFVVYCHPSEDSFTRHVRDSFLKGIADSGHEYELSDLYRMGFRTDMSEVGGVVRSCVVVWVCIRRQDNEDA